MERRDPAVCNDSNKKGGKGEMTKTPVSLQDLRRNLYVKAYLISGAAPERLSLDLKVLDIADEMMHPGSWNLWNRSAAKN